MGIDPYKVSYLEQTDNWLGSINDRLIEQRGESIASVQTDFELTGSTWDSACVRNESMNRLILILLLCAGLAQAAPAEQPVKPPDEPKLYDHYLYLKRLQESMAQRSLEEQERLQGHIRRAEQHACERVRRERQEQVPKEEYRRQGGDEFLVFAQQLEQYCQTNH